MDVKKQIPWKETSTNAWESLRIHEMLRNCWGFLFMLARRTKCVCPCVWHHAMLSVSESHFDDADLRFSKTRGDMRSSTAIPTNCKHKRACMPASKCRRQALFFYLALFFLNEGKRCTPPVQHSRLGKSSTVFWKSARFEASFLTTLSIHVDVAHVMPTKCTYKLDASEAHCPHCIHFRILSYEGENRW